MSRQTFRQVWREINKEHPFIDEIRKKVPKGFNSLRRIHRVYSRDLDETGWVGSVYSDRYPPSEIHRDYLPGKTSIPLAYRAGNVAFVDSRMKNDETLRDILEKAEMEKNPSVVYLHELNSNIARPSHELYTLIAAYALDRIDVEGKTVLDIGAADGILSLQAAKKGARNVYAVELARNPFDEEMVENGQVGRKEYELESKYSEMWPNLFNKHAEHNRIENTEYITGDIFDPEVQKTIPLDKVQIVISNMGPTYDRTHLKIIEMFSEMPKLEMVVLGGYQEITNRFPSPPLSPAEAYEKLKEAGFERKERYIRVWNKNPWESRIPNHLAFVAYRKK